MRKIVGSLFCALLLNASNASASAITLDEAISLLKSQNLEIKSASLEVDAAKADADTVVGKHFGSLNLIQDVANSDDAGNVFGFKLASREATFGDFGAREFMTATGMNGGIPPDSAYTTPPEDLNNPEARTFFQTKLKYELPIFTGFAISSYSNIMNAVTKMKTLNKDALINEEIYQIKKSFYDMALLEKSTKNLNTILDNINTLEHMTDNMIDVGYAKKVDLLEVQAKKGNVARLIRQMESNEKLLYHYISFLLNQKVEEITLPSTNVIMPNIDDATILSQNIDIKKANTGLYVRNEMVNVAHSTYYPMIGAFGEISTADNDFLGEAEAHKSYTVGARLTWNIFNGGIDSATLQKAQVNKLETAAQVQLAKNGIALALAKIRTEIESYDSEIASLEKELLLANEIYKNYEGRYREKLSSMSDVIIKQSQQIEKILQLQEVQNKRNERIFALEKLANGEQK